MSFYYVTCPTGTYTVEARRITVEGGGCPLFLVRN